MAFAITLHLLAAVIWVGGMFFAYMALRPVAGSLLEPPVRQTLWTGVFNRFFPWVWVCIAVLLTTGFWMVFAYLGGMANVGMHVHIMLGLGILMMMLFLHIYFAPFRRLKQAIAENNLEMGAAKLNQIRILIKTNLILGLIVVTIATAGRNWL